MDLYIRIVAVVSLLLIIYQEKQTWINKPYSKYKPSPKDSREEILDKIESLSKLNAQTNKWRRHLLFSMVFSLVISTIIFKSFEPRDIAVCTVFLFVVIHMGTRFYDKNLIDPASKYIGTGVRLLLESETPRPHMSSGLGNETPRPHMSFGSERANVKRTVKKHKSKRRSPKCQTVQFNTPEHSSRQASSYYD